MFVACCLVGSFTALSINALCVDMHIDLDTKLVLILFMVVFSVTFTFLDGSVVKYTFAMTHELGNMSGSWIQYAVTESCWVE